MNQSAFAKYIHQIDEKGAKMLRAGEQRNEASLSRRSQVFLPAISRNFQ
jgi:hypothetical protein